MTWEEFTIFAESRGYVHVNFDDCPGYTEKVIKLDENGAGLEFLITGEVLCANGGFSDDIAFNRTPEQMATIIKALED